MLPLYRAHNNVIFIDNSLKADVTVCNVERGTVSSPTKNKPYLLRSDRTKNIFSEYSFERKMLVILSS